MTLNLLSVALQGASWPLKPIALAVQGLIKELQEEARRKRRIQGAGRFVDLEAEARKRRRRRDEEALMVTGALG